MLLGQAKYREFASYTIVLFVLTFLPIRSELLALSSCGTSQNEALWLLFPFVLILSGIVAISPSGPKLAFISLFIVICCAEVSVRAYEFILEYRYPMAQGEAALWEYDPIRGWKKRALATGVYFNKSERLAIPLSTNSYGLRDDEFPISKPPGEKRVLVLGDSMVEGSEVARAEVFDSVLERLLGSDFRVINAGTRGYGTDQSLIFLREEGISFSPDLILYVFCANDPEDNITIHRPRRMFGKSYFVKNLSGELELRGVPVPKRFKPDDEWKMSDLGVQERYNSNRRTSRDSECPDSLKRTIGRGLSAFKLYRLTTESIKKLWFESSIPDPYVPSDVGWEITELLLQELNNFSAEQGIPLLVYEATNGDVLPELPTNLGQICTKHGIDYIESFASFNTLAESGKRLRFPTDGHWNTLGHQEVARFLAPKIVARLASGK